MAPLRVGIAALALVVLAAATTTSAATAAAVATASAVSQNITSYVPECSWQCLEDSLAAVCSGPTDAECLCDSIATIGPGSRTCVASDCSGNTTATIAAYRAGYVDYCNETGHAVDEAGYYPPGYSGGSQWGSSTTIVTSTTAAATSSSSSSPASSTAAPAAASDSTSTAAGGEGGGGSDLSGGAIAGIAVGGGIACILIAGALLFLAFRLGKKHYVKKQEKLETGEGSSKGGSGGQPDEADVSKEVEATQQRTKAQLDGNPINELHAGYVVTGLDPIKELPTNERPAELSAEPVSHYDSPVLPQSP
ncbi:hypothetical protein GGR53DRAFT_212411 [Hypoxylon sp. FL1150]|nr:hypothetical protein GGR53DRAFT_212411 [Hypoxylon sp. FL1150]